MNGSSTTRDGRPWTPSYLVAIDVGTCIGCGRCFKVCGRDVLTLKGLDEDGHVVDIDEDNEDEIEKKVMTPIDPGACIGCGACARVCPTGSQTHGAADAH